MVPLTVFLCPCAGVAQLSCKCGCGCAYEFCCKCVSAWDLRGNSLITRSVLIAFVNFINNGAKQHEHRRIRSSEASEAPVSRHHPGLSVPSRREKLQRSSRNTKKNNEKSTLGGVGTCILFPNNCAKKYCLSEEKNRNQSTQLFSIAWILSAYLI